MKNYLSRTGSGNGLGFGFWDDPFEDFFKPMFTFERKNHMRTDVKEVENGYEVSVDMPGFEKSEIQVNLSNGYLTVKADKNDKQADESKYLRRERSYSCSRSFYVGESVTEKDIKAKYEQGILTLNIPKEQEKQIPHGNVEIE